MTKSMNVMEIKTETKDKTDIVKGFNAVSWDAACPLGRIDERATDRVPHYIVQEYARLLSRGGKIDIEDFHELAWLQAIVTEVIRLNASEGRITKGNETPRNLVQAIVTLKETIPDVCREIGLMLLGTYLTSTSEHGGPREISIAPFLDETDSYVVNERSLDRP